MIKKAQNLLSLREDNYPENLKSVVAILEPEAKNDGQIAEVLSEAFFWLGEYESIENNKEKYFSKGVAWGKVATSERDTVEAHLWYAANMGSHGLVKGIMSSLSYIKPIEKHGKKR